MSTYVLDTSVAAAWYLPEAFSSAARKWQESLVEQRVILVVPNLHYWEFGNVLRTYARRGEIDEPTALEIFDLHGEAPLTVAEPDRRGVMKAAMVYGATVHDAVYIALAIQSDARLLTAEKTTTPWVVKLGKRVVSVRA